jgi:type IV secretory pathway VirB2 component (pilin)
VRNPTSPAKSYNLNMTKNVSVLIYVLVLVVVIVGVDLLFFRHQFRERLIANVGIVLVSAAFYLRFMAH